MRDFLICIAAFCVKSLIVLAVKPAIISDSWEYVCYAKNLLNSGEFKCLYMADNPVYKNREFYFYRPAGYPLFLAGLMSFLGNHWLLGAKLLQAFLETVCIWLGLRILNSPLLKITWAALLTINSFWTPLFLTESIFSSLLFIAICLRSSAWSGLILFLGVLVRQTGLLILPAFHKNRRAIFILLTLFLTSTAYWMYRNQQLCGKPTARTTNFFRHWVSDAGSYIGIDVKSVARSVENKKCWEFEFDQKLKSALLEKISEKPQLLFKVYFSRLTDFLKIELPFEIRVTLLRLSDMPNTLRLALKFCFYIFYAVVIVAVINCFSEIVVFRRLSSGALAVVAFVLLHPVLSPSNLRFLHGVSLPAILELCIRISKLINVSKPRLNQKY